MPTLSETVRNIRKRLRKTMVQFAGDLGVSASAISQYESGKIAPGEGVLLQLLKFASGDLERSAILQNLGVSAGLVGPADEQQLIEACQELQEYFELVKRDGIPERDITPRNAREQWLRETAKILEEEKLVTPVVVEILRAWRKHGGKLEVRKAFEQFAAYLEVQLRLMEAHGPDRAAVRQPPARPRKARKK